MTDTIEIPYSTELSALRPELEQIAPRDCLPINVDVRKAVFTAHGAMPALARHRGEIAAQLGEEQAAFVDRLDEAARAAGAAYAIHESLGNPPSVEPIAERAVALRQTLLLNAQSLVTRKLASGEKLGGLRGSVGYKNQYLDLLQLVAFFRSDWAHLAPHTTVTEDELDRAKALADELASAVGIREEAGSSASPTALLRDRAWTYFVRTYDEVRRSVTWLRWNEGDADSIAPSLWQGRGGHGSDVGADAPEVSAGAPVGDATDVRPGMPGSSPFMAS